MKKKLHPDAKMLKKEHQLCNITYITRLLECEAANLVE